MAITRHIGIFGEKAVAQHLKEQGYTILHTNYQQFVGEIDIIAKYQQTICFVEVKTRKDRNTFAGHAVPYAKQQKIIAAAQHFRAQYNQEAIYRFDVALVHSTHPDYTITYFADAFSSSSEYA